MNNKELISFIALCSILFSLLLLGESFLIFVIVFITFVISFFFINWLNFSTLDRLKSTNVIGLYLLYLIVLIFSTFFSHSFPVSLLELYKEFFVFILFTFLAAIPSKKIKPELLMTGLVIVGIALVVTSLVFNLIPNFATTLPGMNLLYSKYGHNHLVAYLLLIVPYSWLLMFIATKGKVNPLKLLIFLLPISFLMAFVLSWGRVALLIVVIQMIAVFFFLRKKFTSKLHIKKIFFPIFFLLIVLLGHFIFQVVTFQDKDSCLFKIITAKLCKPIHQEYRGYYWSQAAKAFFEYPLVGYGPGTFSLISEKYKNVPEASTSYAHNIILNTFAESGILVGIAFVALFGFIFYDASKRVWKERDNLFLKMVWLGLVASYLNALVDFDWQFVGIQITNLILYLIIVKKTSSKNKVQHFNKRKLLVLSNKMPILIIAVFTLSLSLLYFFIEFLILKKNINRAVETFPYFSFHKKLFIYDETLSYQNVQKMTSIYEHDYVVLEDIILHKKKFLTKEDEAKVLIKLVDAKPWYREKNSILAYLIVAQFWDQAAEEVNNIVLFNEKINRVRDFEIDFNKRKEESKMALLIADHYFKNRKFINSVDMIKNAYAIEQYSLGDHEPFFLRDTELKLSNKEMAVFVKEISALPSDSLGLYSSVYGEEMISSFLFLASSQSQYENELIEKAVSLDANLVWNAWVDVSTFFQQKIVDAHPEKRIELVENWLLIREILSKWELFSQDEYNLSLANWLYIISESDQTDATKSEQLMNQALKIDPYVLGRN